MKKILTTAKVNSSKYKAEIVIFIFLIIKLFKHYLSADNMVQLALRFLVALLLIAFITYAAGKIIRNAGDTGRETMLILFTLFLVSYAPNTVLLLDNWFKNFDAFKNTFVVICVLLTFKLIDIPKIKWCIPFYCFACLVIQPYFAFTYIPMLAIFFIYKTQFGETRKENKDLMASTLIVSVLAFLFFVLKIFAGKAEIRENLLDNLKQTGLSIVVILPLAVIFTVFLINSYKSSSDKVFRKIILLIIFEPVVAVFSLFTLRSDMNSIMTAVFVQICFIFYFVHIKNTAFLISCERTVRFFQKNIFAVLLSVIYLASFSNFAKIIYIGLTQTKDFHDLWA